MKKKLMPEQGQGLAQPEKQGQLNFAELIPVVPGVIGKQSTSIVNASALHHALCIDSRFTDWIKRRIAEYGFSGGNDYQRVETLSVSNLSSAKSRQQITHEYLITLDMAKELAMVERNEQGRAVRRYFIACEEELQRIAPKASAKLRRELKARITAASHFKPMCAALELARTEQGKKTLAHHYTTESNMISRLVLGGMTAKQWAKTNGVAGDARDSMSTEQLEHFSYLERTNITLIELGQDYPQRKAKLTELSQRWLAKRLGAGHA